MTAISIGLILFEWPDEQVPRVSLATLHTRMGFVELLTNRPDARPSLIDWRMQEDDAPILRYLYRNLRPRRHLEFGTWQGIGTLYCLEECEAAVWTINLLRGESTDEGRPAYWQRFKPGRCRNLLQRFAAHIQFIRGASTFPTSMVRDSEGYYVQPLDSLGLIGRHYLEAGFGHRVCQIYCDSRNWDTRSYPSGFFDTALIDGGHQEEVVRSDTRKAIELVRPGGVILWHDFCPDMKARTQCESVKGVLRAVERDWQWLSGQTSDLFWIEPSWILVGVKR